YYGDEIGMPDNLVRQEDLQDPLGKRHWPAPHGRDPERTPMQWRNVNGGGFTNAGLKPWLPIGDTARHVEDQQADPGSTLHFVRDLIALRRASPDLHASQDRQLESLPNAGAGQRRSATVAAVTSAGLRP